jgi:hypothetical protein
MVPQRSVVRDCGIRVVVSGHRTVDSPRVRWCPSCGRASCANRACERKRGCKRAVKLVDVFAALRLCAVSLTIPEGLRPSVTGEKLVAAAYSVLDGWFRYWLRVLPVGYGNSGRRIPEILAG